MASSLFKNLFKSDKQIQNTIKDTLHELNTPVSTIKINTKMLLKNTSDDKNIQRLNKIDKSCEHLLNMYNDMQYNINKEVNKIDTEQFNLNNMIKESINNFSDIKNDINIEYTDINSFTINTDKNGFLIVINNLISNAIKYNIANGYINIYIEGSILYIKNSSKGIETKNIFKIFDRYYQENSDINGHGIGLNIVKNYCDSNNIYMKIDSILEEYVVVSLDLDKIKIN